MNKNKDLIGELQELFENDNAGTSICEMIIEVLKIINV